MKRFLSFLLIFALLVMAVPPATFAEEERQSGLYTYRVRGNGTLTITKFDWYQNKGDIYIPNMIDGYTVTEIGARHFRAAMKICYVLILLILFHCISA